MGISGLCPPELVEQWRKLSPRVFVDRWCWLVLGEQGPPHQTTRLLLMVLAQYGRRGLPIYPSQETLGGMMGIQARTVRAHIRRALEDQWIDIEPMGKKGQGWRRQQYILRWPPWFDPNKDEWLNKAADRQEEHRTNTGLTDEDFSRFGGY